nr:hypothetical protein [Tanacetum cinerariifolium]
MMVKMMVVTQKVERLSRYHYYGGRGFLCLLHRAFGRFKELSFQFYSTFTLRKNTLTFEACLEMDIKEKGQNQSQNRTKEKSIKSKLKSKSNQSKPGTDLERA